MTRRRRIDPAADASAALAMLAQFALSRAVIAPDEALLTELEAMAEIVTGSETALDSARALASAAAGFAMLLRRHWIDPSPGRTALRRALDAWARDIVERKRYGLPAHSTAPAGGREPYWVQ